MMFTRRGRKSPSDPPIDPPATGATQPLTESPTLASMLNTDDPMRQAALVQLLLQPVITVVLIADPRIDQLQIIPITRGQLSVEQLQKLLHLALEQLMQQSLATLVQQANGHTNGTAPPHADVPEKGTP